MRQRRRSCLQRDPPMCHTTHLCHAEGGSDPLSRSPHYYSLAETDSTRLSVCSESFGLRKCIIGAGCQGDGTIRPQIKEFAAATITCLSCDKTHARPPATTSQHRSWKLKLFQTQIRLDRFIVGELVCPCHAALVESTKSLKLQFHYFLCNKTDSFKFKYSRVYTV